MQYNLEKLKTDPAYWDRVAPKGATHYISDRDCFSIPWEKHRFRKRWVFDSTHGVWQRARFPFVANEWDLVIKRPKHFNWLLWITIIVVVPFLVFVGYTLIMDCPQYVGYNPYCGPDLFEEPYKL